MSNSCSKYPLVCIVILNWNKLEETKECLKSVVKTDYPNYKVIVADNNSHDDPSAIIKKQFAEVIVIRNGVNEGYATGNNTAIRFALGYDPGYILLLNNDTIIDQNCISQIVKKAEESDKIGLVSPVIYYFEEPEKVQFAGSKIKWRDLSISDFNSIDEIENSDVCLWGTALLIKRKLLDALGFLKDEYFAYWEDTEYSLRSLRNGFINVVCSEAKVYHVGQIEINEKKRPEYFFYYMNRNRLFLGDDFILNRCRLFKYKLRCIAETANFIHYTPKEICLASLEGLWHGLKKVYGQRKIKGHIPFLFKNVLIVLSRLHPLFLLDILTFDFEQRYLRIRRVLKGRIR
jgi:GT2 family glycosyltransferase